MPALRRVVAGLPGRDAHVLTGGLAVRLKARRGGLQARLIGSASEARRVYLVSTPRHFDTPTPPGTQTLTHSDTPTLLDTGQEGPLSRIPGTGRQQVRHHPTPRHRCQPTLPRHCPDTPPTLLNTPTLRHCRAQPATTQPAKPLNQHANAHTNCGLLSLLAEIDTDTAEIRSIAKCERSTEAQRGGVAECLQCTVHNVTADTSHIRGGCGAPS